MSEMVDKALRAWLVKSHDYVGTVCLFEELRPDELAQGRDCMRAALAALGEPTEAMQIVGATENVQVAHTLDHKGRCLTPSFIWRAMIDEALR